MSTLSDALLAVAEAQRAEAAVIRRQRAAAADRSRALESVAADFRKAAALATEEGLCRLLGFYAAQRERDARTAKAEASTLQTEYTRVLREARINVRRARGYLANRAASYSAAARLIRRAMTPA